MKRLGLIALIAAGAALAGEGWVGTLRPVGASTHNKGVTGDAGFWLPASQKITVQCANIDGGSASVNVCIDVATCTARLGVLITGNQALPTSTAISKRALADGGYSALVSAISTDNAICDVFTRAGNEF